MTTAPVPQGTPKAEVAVDPALVASLLAAQHPDLARLPISLLDEGWDNVMFRLGDALVVRMPRRAAAVALIDREQAWLPSLAGSLPLAVPAPVRRGTPGAGYPWPWSVVPWIAGETADLSPPNATEARALGRFLTALHRPAPANAPRNPVRGVPLATRREMAEARAAREQAMRACDDVSDDTWARARGWAFAFGVMLLDSGLADHPRHAAMGRDTLRRLADGP